MLPKYLDIYAYGAAWPCITPADPDATPQPSTGRPRRASWLVQLRINRSSCCVPVLARRHRTGRWAARPRDTARHRGIVVSTTRVPTSQPAWTYIWVVSKVW